MRGLRVVVAAVSCWALAGCAATTRPAGDLTAASARLNAAGLTNGTPAHYYFQYSTAPNALGTGRQSRLSRVPFPYAIAAGMGGVGAHVRTPSAHAGQTLTVVVAGLGGDTPGSAGGSNGGAGGNGAIAAGGGGSSLITSTALCSSPVDTGVQGGDGMVTITYNPPTC